MNFLLKLALVAVTAIIGIGTPLVVKKITKKEMKDDNLIEELAEKVIEETTGLDVDLTPESLEDDEDNIIIGVQKGKKDGYNK